jgi:GTP-binding protein Era
MTKSGFVAIIGRPNAGKSTLLNGILGAPISIVTPKAQTTRERVLGILTEDGNQMVFVDTPGIHRAKHGGINAYMMSEAREALEEPSIIWYLIDPSSALQHESAVLELLKGRKAPVFLLLNKIDTIRGREWREKSEVFQRDLSAKLTEMGVKVEKVMNISASEGTGLETLLSESWKLLPEGPLYYPDEEQLSDRPLRFFAAEKIREQLLLQLGEEIPYACAVEIQKFEEPKPKDQKPMVRIEAVIHVERDSQKGMVIGKGGKKIKDIGQAAREKIQEFIGGGPIFLGLQVKVYKDWTRDAEALKRLGYHLPEKSPAKKSSGQTRTASS